jgi:glycosyltransferase involved in cell wall biosynthesis
MNAGFSMEQDVGHAVQALHIRREVCSFPGIASRHVAVTFYKEGGLIERLSPVPAYVRAAFRARLEVVSGLRGFRPDVVLWNTQKPAMFCPDILRSVPSVISLDVTPKQYDDFGEAYGHIPDGNGFIARAKHAANRWVFQKAERLIPATRWAADSLISDYGVDPSRIVVIPPGTDVSRFVPPTSRPSDTDGIVRILFVGGDFIRKGGDLLVEWMLSSPLAAGCQLDLVTEAELPVHPKIRSHRLSHDDDDLARLYREADIFVLPTRAECFGLVLTEAMASGLPVVTCPVGGLGDVVEHDTTGLLVPPDDAVSLDKALASLINDADMRRRLGAAGRRMAEERFDARKNVARVLQVMGEVAEADRKRRPGGTAIRPGPA